MSQSIVAKRVEDFYYSESVSRILPTKKDVDTDHDGVLTHKFLMVLTQRAAFETFRELNSNYKIGQRSFDKLRPKNVCHVSQNSRFLCLCTLCQNVKLKLKALQKEVKSLDKNTCMEENEVVKSTLCEYVHQPNANCLLGTCSNCGVGKLDDKYEAVLTNHGEHEMKWQVWEYKTIKLETNEVRNLKLINKGKINECMKELKELKKTRTE